MPLLRWAKASSLRDGEQLSVGTTHCSIARLSRLFPGPSGNRRTRLPGGSPDRGPDKPSSLTLSRARPLLAGRGHLSAVPRGWRPPPDSRVWPRRPKCLPGEGAEEAGRPPLLTRTRLLTAACTADTGAVRSGMAFPSTSPSSCMMTRWEICWATGSRMLSMVRVWKTGMAAAGRGAGAQTQHKLLPNSVPAGWRPTEKAAASALRGKRGRTGNQTTSPNSPRLGAESGTRRSGCPAQARGGGTRTRCPPAARWQRPPRTGAAPQPGGGFSTATARPARGSRPRPLPPMAEPRPPLPVAQRRVHQHSRASFPLRPSAFPAPPAFPTELGCAGAGFPEPG